MRLLFINSLKGLKKKKIQMLGIIMMVMLSTAIYVAMSVALDRMEDRYYNYLEEQNVEYLSVDSYVDYTKDVSVADLNDLLKNKLSVLSETELAVINTYKCVLDESICVIDYLVNPLDNPMFIYSISSIFEKYEADLYIKEKKIDTIKDKYDFYYELDRSKTLKEDDTYVKVIPYNESKKINKAYLLEGKLPTKNNEITMMPKYAEINDLEIGDNYSIGGVDYKIVGFTYAPDYIYPIVSFSAPVFDEAKNNVIYINNDDYSNVNGVEEKSYSIVYNKDVSRKFEITIQTDPNAEDTSDDSMIDMFEEEQETISYSMFTMTRLARIGALQMEFKSDRLFAEYFLYLLLSVAVFIIVIITKKRIDDEKLQIGVLKSLGYSPLSIAVSYLVYPIIGALIGGLLGYTIGIIIHGPLANFYISYFVIPLDNFKFDLNYLKNCTLIPMIFLSLLSYLIAIFMLRKKPLYLLKEGSNLHVNIFTKIANKITSKLSFKYRFKYSLAFRSIPKLIVVALTSFFTGMLIVLTLIGMNLMNGLIEKSFAGLNYDYFVSMSNSSSDEFDEDADYVLKGNFNLLDVKDSEGNYKTIDEDIIISVTGIDIDSKYIKVLDESGKNNNSKLAEANTIIINANMQNLYDINIGDTIVLKISDSITSEYKVIEICNEFMNVTGYVNREYLSKKSGFEESVYNAILSNNDKYSNLEKLDQETVSNIVNVLSLKDLKNNIEKQMQMYNTSIYIVILFASLMALIIIAVIANIVVEENKKTISLMKVMGYTNKQISSIVLNIYTPVIVISYLLSIPAMIKLLEKIVSVLAGDMDMTIPISLSPTLAIVGLIGLLVAYYIAIGLSRKVLNKVPLAVALKRE